MRWTPERASRKLYYGRTNAVEFPAAQSTMKFHFLFVLAVNTVPVLFKGAL